MSIPGRLYYTGVSPEVEVVHTRMRIERRTSPVVATYKSSPWEDLSPGAGSASLRVVLEGIGEGTGLALLLDHWAAVSLDGYRIALDSGEQHTGTFLVAEVDEVDTPEEHRRFTAVLRSSGAVSYTPAP